METVNTAGLRDAFAGDQLESGGGNGLRAGFAYWSDSYQYRVGSMLKVI